MFICVVSILLLISGLVHSIDTPMLTCNPYPAYIDGQKIAFAISFDGQPDIDIDGISSGNESIIIMYPLDGILVGSHSVVAKARIVGTNMKSDPSEPCIFIKEIPAVPMNIGLTTEE